MKDIIMVFCFSFIVNVTFSQTKFVIEPNVSPVLFPLGNFAVEDDSEEYYSFNFKESFSPKYGLSLSFLLNSGWEFGLNSTYFKYRYEFDRQVYDVTNSANILDENSGYLEWELLGATPFIKYNHKKISFSLGYQVNQVLYIKKSEKFFASRVVGYVVEDKNGMIQLFGFNYTEVQDPSPSPFALGNIELLVQYEIVKNTRLTFGLSYIGFGDPTPNYKFYNHGDNEDGQDVVLNDIKIYNRTLFTQIGVSYRFYL